MIFKRSLSKDYIRKRYTDAQSKFLEIGGMEIHYKIEGSGPYLVLLHGISASLHSWDKWTEILKKDFTIVRMDLPGFGVTGPNESHDYSMKYYVNFLKSFIEKLHIDRFSLAGNSMGGEITWIFASKYPEKIEKVIFVAASGYYKDKTKFPALYKLVQKPWISWIMPYLDPKLTNRRVLEEIFTDKTKITPEIEERYAELSLREGNRKAFVEKVKLVGWENIPFDLSRLKMPVLILWGEKDRWLPVVIAHKFGKDLPHAKKIVYPNVGHAPMEEIPELSAIDVKKFILESDN